MKQRITALLIIFVFTASFMLTGCTTFDNFKGAFLTKEKAESETVKVGVYEPMSGEDKENGKLEIQGIELAHDLFPEVLGKKVELVYADNKSDIDIAKSAAQELVDKKVSIILGSYGSTYSLIGGEYFTKAKIPAIDITSTNPLVTNSNEYYFRTSFVQAFQGVAVAKYAAEQIGVKKAAIMRDSADDYAFAVSQSFSDKFIGLTKDDASIVKVIEYTAKNRDFEAQLKEIQASGAEVIFLACNAKDAAAIIKTAKEIGVQSVFLGTDDWETDEFISEGGKAVEGVVFSTFFDSESSLTENTDVFLKAYHKKYGKDVIPESSTALGFDSYLLAMNAISNAGTSKDGEAIKDALAKTKKFPGASGMITFDENGDPIKSVIIKTVANGKFVHLYTVEPSWQ